MAKQTETKQASTGKTAAGVHTAEFAAALEATGKSKWASERSRALSGERTATGREGAPCKRHIDFAAVLLAVRQLGKSAITFADCNAASGTKRGERGQVVPSWSLHLSRGRQVLPSEFEGWSVDGDAGRIVFADGAAPTTASLAEVQKQMAK